MGTRDCIFAVSHAASSCKSVLPNGCSFKHDSHQDVFLDCGFISLDEAPKIGKDCTTPKGMVLKLKTALTKQTIQNVPSTLKTLTIHVSNLQTLPVDIFDRFVNLRVLRLPINHLKTLSERTFKHLHKLEKLEVTSNNLHCDCRLRWIKKSSINVDAKCASPSSLANKELKSISLAELCDVDECVSDTHDCSPIATCTNTVGSFDCMCKSGYRGNGRKCFDFNECSLGGSLCDPKTSTCVNTDGSYLCSCKKGFYKKGNVCVDHNECSESIHKCAGEHVKCVNTMGSYKCGCQPGFLENESSCIDIDECSTAQHNCSIQATCTNLPGGFRCSCNIGYLGNGHFCVELAEVSMMKRLMQKNRVFSFLVKHKLVPHALIAAASLLLLIPVSLCLCVCCCRRRRRRRRRKNKEYERVPTRDTDEFRRSRQQKGRFFRRGKQTPSSLRKPSVKRVVEDDVEPINTYQSTPAPPVPSPPSAFAPPPPPPPPPPVKRQPNV